MDSFFSSRPLFIRIEDPCREINNSVIQSIRVFFQSVSSLLSVLYFVVIHNFFHSFFCVVSSIMTVEISKFAICFSFFPLNRIFLRNSKIIVIYGTPKKSELLLFLIFYPVFFLGKSRITFSFFHSFLLYNCTIKYRHKYECSSKT